jgi:hypothetical protein
MVPHGKTCLCVEFFCVGDDPILRISPKEQEALAIRECAANGLIDATFLVDTLVTTMRRSNAAASWRDWQNATKLRLLERIARFENLYHVNRPGTDWATFAGMMAAEAILCGSRAEFDRRADPTRRYSAAQNAATGAAPAPAQPTSPGSVEALLEPRTKGYANARLALGRGALDEVS